MIDWTNRSIVLLFAGMQLLGQQNPSPSAPAANPTTGTRGNPTNPNNIPTLNPNNPNNPDYNNPLADRPIFLSGRVMFDDGSPMNQDVRIERVCGTTIRTEAHVDSKGRFSFQVGNNSAYEISSADSSQSGFGTGAQGRNNSPFGGSGGFGNSRGNSEQMLMGCELRAASPGYRSDEVTLTGRHSMDDPNVGTIILHRLANVRGTTISLTTAQAPKSAQKSFEKGLQAARKGKFEDAEKLLTSATEEYPKYAVAWFTLGQVQQSQNKTEGARKSFLTALEADKKYVSPYDQLALLAARENKWEEAADYSRQAIDLNPVEFPSSFWYNAVANYNLNKDAEAAKSGQALIKLDARHKYPEINRLLAEISLRKKEYSGAAGYLKSYLAQVPAAKDADALKQQLLKIEEASAAVPNQ